MTCRNEEEKEDLFFIYDPPTVGAGAGDTSGVNIGISVLFEVMVSLGSKLLV